MLDASSLSPEKMISNLDQFSNRVLSLLSQIGLDLCSYPIDHIALRINELQLAVLAHRAWKSLGKEISTAQINGRPIIVFKLKGSLNVGGWSVDCLELPYPAEGKIYPEQGWEHVEFVISSEAQTVDEYLAELKARFPVLKSNWDNFAQMGIKTKLSSPKGSAERLVNPTVAFKKDGVCIKLHPHRLEDIVMSEMN